MGLEYVRVDVVDESGFGAAHFGEEGEGFCGAQVEGKVEGADADQRKCVGYYFGCLGVEVEVELRCEEGPDSKGRNRAAHQTHHGHLTRERVVQMVGQSQISQGPDGHDSQIPRVFVRALHQKLNRPALVDQVVSPDTLRFELPDVALLLAPETVLAEVVVLEVGSGEAEAGTWVVGKLPLKMGMLAPAMVDAMRTLRATSSMSALPSTQVTPRMVLPVRLA